MKVLYLVVLVMVMTAIVHEVDCKRHKGKKHNHSKGSDRSNPSKELKSSHPRKGGKSSYKSKSSKSSSAVKVCGELPSVADGHLDLDSYGYISIGATATLTCSAEFEINGNAVVRCQCNRTWTEPGECIKVCGELPSIADGHLDLDVYGYSSIGAAATLTCSAQFEINGNAVVMCQSNGTWTEPGDCIKVCGELPSIADGHLDLDVYGYSSIGATATLTCSAEFEIDGNAVVTCQYNGTWTEPGECIKECEALPVVVGGSYTTTSFLPGSSANLTCVTNFTLINAPATITCQSDKTWTSTKSCCFGLVDLVFVLDGSNSILPDNFELLKTFLQDLVTLVETPNTQFALLLFSSRPVVIFNLNEYGNRPEAVKDHIADTKFPWGLSYTGRALNLVRTSMLTTKNGLRADATQVVFVIVDGKSYDVQDMLIAAAAMRDIGVKIMALGVRLRDTSELKAIASQPEFVLQANFTSASLAAVQSQVQAALCNLTQPDNL